MDPSKLRSLLFTSELTDRADARAPAPSAPTLGEAGELAGFAGFEDGELPPFQTPEVSPGLTLGGLLEFGSEPSRARENTIGLGTWLPAAPGLAGLPAHLAALVPTLMALKARILEELEANPMRLRSLNQSRREALAQYLDRMAGLAPASSSPSFGLDPTGGLRRWIEGPRTPSQNLALQAYFEEVALLVLGQALLLKAWSDRGIRPLVKNDLGQLNWALSTALRPQIPLDREGWQLTRQNIYSWYNPSKQIQEEIWGALETWRVTDEGPSLITFIAAQARHTRLPEGCASAEGYDARFFKALWDHCPLFGFNPAPDTGPLKRPRVVFSPTLRDGTMVQAGPVSVSWVGLESSAFALMAAELVQLWWGPAPPPLWSVGNGLEAHARDQLTLALGSPKPSLLTRITEMEACDAAFVLEERKLVAHGRGLEAQRLREQLDTLPYFRKLRSPGTTLGDLQACVALSKLRPGGLLWWAREEPLTSGDGTEMLHFLLERAKVVADWDFSELKHELPAQLPLFPKHLYLLAREPRVEERLSHRPARIAVQGALRSHVEFPQMLESVFRALSGGALSSPGVPPAAGSRLVGPGPAPANAPWQVHLHPSPSPQREWMERWPDPAGHDQLRLMDRIRVAALPLASSTTVKLTPDGDPAKDGQWSVSASMRGLWLRSEQAAPGASNSSSPPNPNSPHPNEERRLVVEPLPRVGSEAKGSGFMVLVADESWVAPLMAYLGSAEVRAWLDHHAERRGGRWLLNEQLVRYIPVPKILLATLGAPAALEAQGAPGSASFAHPLPGDWEKRAAEIPHDPSGVREALQRLELPQLPGVPGPDGTPSLQFDEATRARIRATIFVRAARAHAQMLSGQGRLLSVVTREGRIRWRELLEILPKAECTAITFSPRVKITGQLPPHLPIGRIDRVRGPQPGILLSTEIGLSMQLAFDSPVLLEMVWEQLDGLLHPTWNELIQYLRVPRRLEIAEATAGDVLRSHGEQSKRLEALGQLVVACRLF
jgi:hypothetical protein